MNYIELNNKALELKMIFQECSTLAADDLRDIIDLIIALNDIKKDKDGEDSLLEIYSFQFDNLENDINDINLITDSFLNVNGIYHSENRLLEGTNIQADKVGRIGFRIKNSKENPYYIHNLLNDNITDTIFDYIYDSGISYFVSKDYVAPSINYFKFINNNN